MKRTIIALSLLYTGQLFAQSGGMINGTRGFPQPNDASGTTVNTLVTISTSGTAIAATTGNTSVPTYIVVGGAGTTGNAVLAASGTVAPCLMDASSTTIGGAYVVNSTTVATECHVQISAPSAGTWVIGYLHDSSTTSGATALIDVASFILGGANGGGGLGDPGGNGLVFRSSLNTTRTAASADVINLWGGTCSISTFLRGDGSCAAVSALADPGSNGLTFRTSLNVTRVAASADVIALFSGTCSITTYLRGDGACATTPTGTVTQNANLTTKHLIAGGNNGTSDVQPDLIAVTDLSGNLTMASTTYSGAGTFKIDFPTSAAPANPSSGFIRVFGNSGTGNLACLTSSGGNCLPSSGGGLADPGSNGLLSRTALNTTVARSLVGSGLAVVTNADGTAGNPTVSVTGSGNTTTAATTTGTLTNGDYASFDANGNVKDSGVPIIATSFVQVSGGSASIGTVTANNIKLFGVANPAQFTSTKVSYNIAVADNTANNYDIGFYNSAGTLVCHLGATAGTTFSPSTGEKTLSWTASCTMPPGIVYFAFTGNAATAALGGSSGVWMPVCGAVSSTTSSGGALPSSVTLPSISPASCAPPNAFGY